MRDDNFLIKKMPNTDAPILNGILKSKVFFGKLVKETVNCSYFVDTGEIDDKGNKIIIKKKVKLTFSGDYKLDSNAFEYYARCLKIINNKCLASITMTLKEFIEFSGMSKKRVDNNIKEINEFLTNLLSVKASYELEDGTEGAFTFMSGWKYKRDIDEMTLSFSDAFIEASKLLFTRHFDVDMYSKLKSTNSRSMMWYLESRSSTKKYTHVNIRKDEFLKRVDINKGGDQQSKQESVALKKGLEDLKKVGFISGYTYKNTGIHKENPLYKITIIPKGQRTIERDIENEVKKLTIENGNKSTDINVKEEGKKKYKAKAKKSNVRNWGQESKDLFKDFVMWPEDEDTEGEANKEE
jgi:hypothetical protein